MSTVDVSATAASRKVRAGICPGCRRCVRLTFHHLIPRKMHRRKRFKNAYSKQQLSRGLYVCRLCHNGIHQRFDEMELALRYSDPQQLLAAPALQQHFRWVSRQKEDWDS